MFAGLPFHSEGMAALDAEGGEIIGAGDIFGLLVIMRLCSSKQSKAIVCLGIMPFDNPLIRA